MMRAFPCLRLFLALAFVAFLVRDAQGAQGERKGELEWLPSHVDVIFKGTLVSSTVTNETLLEPTWETHRQEWRIWESRFHIISVIQGTPQDGMKPGMIVQLRHYGLNPGVGGYVNVGDVPLHYEFEKGQTYIVLAKRSESRPGVLRQFWEYSPQQHDKSILLCADAEPVRSADIKEIYWTELTHRLQSKDPSMVSCAIGQLECMSVTEGWIPRFSPGDANTFAREQVLAAYRPLLSSTNARVLKEAIRAIGCNNPYATDGSVHAIHMDGNNEYNDNGYAEAWLGSIGDYNFMLARMDPKAINPGAKIYGKELIAIASGTASGEIRAMAIRALGRWGGALLKKPLEDWIADPAPAVRAAAMILFSDFPDENAQHHLRVLAKDAHPEVRTAVALGIGYSRSAELVDLLDNLLADEDKEVRRCASLALCSFSPDKEAVSRILKTHLDSAEFGALFQKALDKNPVKSEPAH